MSIVVFWYFLILICVYRKYRLTTHHLLTLCVVPVQNNKHLKQTLHLSSTKETINASSQDNNKRLAYNIIRHSWYGFDKVHATIGTNKHDHHKTMLEQSNWRQIHMFHSWQKVDRNLAAFVEEASLKFLINNCTKWHYDSYGFPPECMMHNNNHHNQLKY